MSARLSIAAAAAETPEAPALIDESGTCSYAELAAQVRQRARGLDPALPLVATAHTDRATAVDLFAALEVGCPYAPLHPAWSEDERNRARTQLAADPPEAEESLILFTSGSQGRAGAAAFSRQALAASAAAVSAATGFARGSRWLCTLPTAHVGGLAILLRSLYTRASAAVLPFQPAAVARMATRHRVTHISLVPTMLEQLLDEPHFETEALRCVLLGGAAVGETLRRRCRERQLPVVVSYGMTETGSMIAADGAPLPGVEVDVAADGRLRVRTPSLFRRYLGGGGPNADGWHTTGDRARWDGHKLHILGRADDVIISGGENVDPGEVELALCEIEGITEAFVCGVVDVRWGQAVAAAVVSDRDPDLSRLRGRLAPFKCPRHVYRVDALPHRPGGKVDRAQAREVLQALHGARQSSR